MVLSDYAHTPDALERALATLRPLTAGRLIVVFGCGGDRDRGKRPIMGRIAAEAPTSPIVTSDNPRTEDPDAIIDDIEQGMGGVPHVRIADRRAAILARARARPARATPCSSRARVTRPIRSSAPRSVPFDEREIVQEAVSDETRAATATDHGDWDRGRTGVAGGARDCAARPGVGTSPRLDR